MSELLRYKRLHITRLNTLVHRVITRFVELVQKEREKISEEQVKFNVSNRTFDQASKPYRFCFVYTDFIQPQYTGSIRSRVLAAFPLNTDEKAFESNESLTFVKVESRVIKSITINILNEFAEPIQLPDSNFSTYVCLYFRKIRDEAFGSKA